MYTVRIENTFAAAHFLQNYNGKCENLHGHNYRVRVTAKGPDLGEGGMLLDFGILKKGLKEIFKQLDHVHLNEMEEFSDGNPSAERLAAYIYHKISSYLKDRTSVSVRISLVEVFETEKNLAAYSPD